MLAVDTVIVTRNDHYTFRPSVPYEYQKHQLCGTSCLGISIQSDHTVQELCWINASMAHFYVRSICLPHGPFCWTVHFDRTAQK
jgi:hypothetical protein